MRNAERVYYAFCDLRGDYFALCNGSDSGTVDDYRVYGAVAVGRDSVPGLAARGVAGRGEWLLLSGDVDGRIGRYRLPDLRGMNVPHSTLITVPGCTPFRVAATAAVRLRITGQ